MKRYNIIKLGSKEYNKNHKPVKLVDGNIWMFETTMNIMMNYVKKNGIALLSAFRGDYDERANFKRHNNMKNQFKKNKIKIIEVNGFWVENYGEKDERHVAELSMAVPYFSEDWIGDLYESKLSRKELAIYKDLFLIEGGRQASDISFAPTSDMLPFDKFSYFVLKVAGIFNQDAVVIAHPKKGVYLHYRTGEKDYIGSKASKDKIGEAYTQLREGKDTGRTFIFEGTRSPHNHVDAYKLMNEGIIF